MHNRQLSSVVHFIRQLADDGPSDAQLLDRFARTRDEEAFTCLVRRHGSLVLGVCRRVLRQEQDAEDVFQATFLVLARSAASIRKKDAVGSWLHGVATRLALRARAKAARRLEQGRSTVDIPAAAGLPDIVWHDLRPILDEEINALPDKYREAFVLCHLQDVSNVRAARQLDCPVGTVLSRLARARELLRRRLTRRGVTLSSTLLVSVLAQHAGAEVVPMSWVAPTMRAALAFAAGKGTVTGLVSSQALTFAEGVFQAMFFTRMKIVAVMLLVGGIVGTAVYSQQAPADKSSDPFEERADNLPKAKRSTANTKRADRPYADSSMEALRLANKLLEEEIEDEKAKLEALQRKLERLKKSGIKASQDDPEVEALKRTHRRLQRGLRRIQEEVSLAEEDVQPYLQVLQRGAAGHDAKSPYWGKGEAK
jgi:RNA polymerase sigma factor (sigma-70 family)